MIDFLNYRNFVKYEVGTFRKYGFEPVGKYNILSSTFFLGLRARAANASSRDAMP